VAEAAGVSGWDRTVERAPVREEIGEEGITRRMFDAQGATGRNFDGQGRGKIKINI
jgi:hypothetical protein